jgi:TfoX/Sxy family transcriptional regulator of competence genes
MRALRIAPAAGGRGGRYRTNPVQRIIETAAIPRLFYGLAPKQLAVSGAGFMAVDEDLVGRVRAFLAGNGALREVRMFGGLCFMLNGNMVAGTSNRGLLVRVGKEQHAGAVARPDARPMEMSGRMMAGYVVIDPPPKEDRVLREWLELAVAFVQTLPAKSPKSDLDVKY